MQPQYFKIKDIGKTTQSTVHIFNREDPYYKFMINLSPVTCQYSILTKTFRWTQTLVATVLQGYQ